MMFAFFVSLIGFAFAHRIACDFVDHQLFHQSEMTKIGTAYFAFVFVCSHFIPRTYFWMWLIVFVPLIFLVAILGIVVWKRSTAFRSEFVNVVSLIILKMKSGRAFRLALGEVIDETRGYMRVRLAEIASVVAFSQQENQHRFDPFVTEMIDELTVIDRLPHSSLRRLETLREKLRIEDDFRRRSGQALARIRAQSLVMSILYAAMLTMTTWKFGWEKNANLIGLSLTLYSIGAVWIWMGGRRIKWKV